MSWSLYSVTIIGFRSEAFMWNHTHFKNIVFDVSDDFVFVYGHVYTTWRNFMHFFDDFQQILKNPTFISPK